MSQLKRKKKRLTGIDSKYAQHKGTMRHHILLIGAIAALSFFLVTILHPGFSQIINNTSSKSYKIVPEYQRELKKIVISLGIRETDLDLHTDLLRILPEYTEITILLPEHNMQPLKDLLKDQPFGKRTSLIGFDTKPLRYGHMYLIFPERDKLMDTGPIESITALRGSLWSQDLFEVAKRQNGQTLLLISDLHKWFIAPDKDSPLKVISDNYFLGKLSAIGVEIKRLPLTFKGGNILTDVVNDRKIAICGGDVFRLTRTVWKSSRDSTPSDKKITNMIEQFFNVDEVLVVGSKSIQPSLMFHLDQAMVILSNGIVGVTRVAGASDIGITEKKEIEEIETFLSELRLKLLGIGYKLVDMETSIHNILNYQYYVNGIPYIDATTGQKTYLMPIYPSGQTEYEAELIKKNTATLEEIGYSVVHVPSMANKYNGGIHCLVNVLE